MGYACPVCEERQVDAEHLANHLAFTAILRGGDHEAWLDEHVPTWDEQDPKALGATVAQYAESVTIDHPDDASEVNRDHVEGQADRHTRLSGRTAGVPAERLSSEERAVLEEARELTRRKLEDSDGTAGVEQGKGEPDVESASPDADRSDSEKE